MQFARLNGVVVHYQVIPAAANKPRVVFANSLGSDFRIWRDVVVRLVGEVSILLYDMRGHGLSETGDTPYTIETLGADLAALIEHTGFGPAIICGSSAGGLAAQALYAARPELVEALVLVGIAHKVGTHQSWSERIAAVTADGIASVVDKVLAGWFTAEFRKDTATVAGYRTMITRQAVEGYLATVAAIRDADFTDLAPRIRVPVICVAGESDPTCPPAMIADFARMIPGARYELMRPAGHLPFIEQPAMMAEIVRAAADLAGARHAA